MVDLRDVVVDTYYSLYAKGSNSIKHILPAVLASSVFENTNTVHRYMVQSNCEVKTFPTLPGLKNRRCITESLSVFRTRFSPEKPLWLNC